MGMMTRWHKMSCKTPDVFVDGEAPRCRTCNSVPPLEELIAHQASLDPFLPIPQDEPAGQMALWWPPDVSYSHPPDVKPEAIKDMNKGVPLKDDASPSIRAASEADDFVIYGSTLGPDEFRLLCLYAVDDGSYPIHITLETFQHNECPEYETVSYTWGGEDGDSTPCRPVFVGPYWDVLLQTRNCWAMLRHLRPWRGIRIVWVDAICINQNNLTERASQVAKMRAIYRDCMRVVVYLGDDLVSNSRRHPARHGLHELDHIMKDSEINLRTLLSRRYFSRVWVIQELLLSQNAIIPVGDMEFWAGSVTAKHLETLPSLWSWDSTDAPWAQFMGQGSFDEENIYLVLRRTWQSKASDPRDKIFGILGLLNFQATGFMKDGLESNVLKPDYSISAQHAFIGIFAHCLINLATTGVLLNASGLAAPPANPSWVPDWRRLETLKEELEEPRLTNDQPVTQRTQIVQSWRPCLQVYMLPLSLQPTTTGFRDIQEICWETLPLSLSSSDRRPGRLVDQEVQYEHSWRRNASIDPSTGALSIKLGHILQFKSSPVLKIESGTLRMYEVRTESCALYMSTDDVSLDTLIPPGPNHLFYLEKEDGSGCLLLFLRELEMPKTYKLVVCCSYCDLFLLCPRPVGFTDGFLNYVHNVDLHESLNSVLSDALDFIGGRQFLDHRLHEVPYLSNEQGNGFRQIFPGDSFTVRDILPVCQGLIDESRGSTPTFVEAYVACLMKKIPKSRPKVEDGFVELTFDPEQWTSCNSYYQRQTHEYGARIRWEWRFESTRATWFKNQWKSCLTDTWGPWKSTKPVHVRASVDGLSKYLRETGFYLTLSRLSFARDLVSEDEKEMFTRGPQWEDHFVPYRPWPQCLVDEFALDGLFQHVQIL
jgi:Heterokaryon incompatibility protein (HET)